MRGSVIRRKILGHALTSLPAFSRRGFTLRRKAIVKSIAIGMKADASTNVQPNSPKNSEEIFCDHASGNTLPRGPVRPKMKNQATAKT
jgi:hypothetical protein